MVSVIPRGIKISISAGVGLFIAAIGLRNAHIIAADAKKTALSFGDLSQPAVWTAAAGMILLLVLQSRHVKGGALLAILGGTLLGIPLGVTHFPQTFFSVPEGVGSIFMRFDIMGALSLQYVPICLRSFFRTFFPVWVRRWGWEAVPGSWTVTEICRDSIKFFWLIPWRPWSVLF